MSQFFFRSAIAFRFRMLAYFFVSFNISLNRFWIGGKVQNWLERKIDWGIYLSFPPSMKVVRRQFSESNIPESRNSSWGLANVCLPYENSDLVGMTTAGSTQHCLISKPTESSGNPEAKLNFPFTFQPGWKWMSQLRSRCRNACLSYTGFWKYHLWTSST